MKKLQFKTHINAPVEKVWNTMFEDKTYREWTSVFMPGSYYEGSWEKGSDIRFVAPEADGTLSGMLCKIAENILHEFVSIQYVGVITKGVEDTTSDNAKSWNSGHENYTFKESNGGTDLIIDLDTDEDMAADFEAMWPKGLEKLKELAER